MRYTRETLCLLGSGLAFFFVLAVWRRVKWQSRDCSISSTTSREHRT
jgi:hypothetical protein